MAYNKVRKFQVRSPVDLKAGTYINCRETMALSNMFVVVVKLNGRAIMVNSKIGMKFPKAVTLGSEYDTCTPWLSIDKPVDVSRKKLSRIQHGGMFSETMVNTRGFGTNISFHYNSKTKAFVELLKKASRFQQHCIFFNCAYSQKEYDSFKEYVEYLDWTDQLCNDALNSNVD